MVSGLEWKIPVAVGLGALAIYPTFLLICISPWVQKQAIYAHRIKSFWHDLDDVESWGFGKNQVSPLNIKTSDGEILHAFHILPRALYAKHEDELTSFDSTHIQDFKSSRSFKLLTEDPNSKLIINFHGNAGHLLQNQRPYVYRSFSTLSPDTHVLAFSYRGFGRSTGSPSENGLITDGVSVVNYALHELGIPAKNIALTSQSLGTAVVSGVLEHFGTQPGKIADFATVLLVSGFRDMRSNLLKYRMGGVVPVLSPLAWFPSLQKLIVSFIAEPWDSNARLRAVVSRAVLDTKAGEERHLKVQLMHAIDDPDIHFESSEGMYDDLLKLARVGLGDEVDSVEIGSIEEKALRRNASWPGISLEFRLVRRGGHNAIPTDTPVATALIKALGLLDGI